METELDRDPITAGVLVVTRMDTQADQGLIVPAGTQGIVTKDYGKALEVQFIGYDEPMTVNSFNMSAVSNIPVDPTDWRARALKAEKALRTIDTVTSMRVSKYLKSSAFTVQHLSYEHWQSIKIDEALDTCADVIRTDKGVVDVG